MQIFSKFGYFAGNKVLSCFPTYSVVFVFVLRLLVSVSVCMLNSGPGHFFHSICDIINHVHRPAP